MLGVGKHVYWEYHTNIWVHLGLNSLMILATGNRAPGSLVVCTPQFDCFTPHGFYIKMTLSWRYILFRGGQPPQIISLVISYISLQYVYIVCFIFMLHIYIIYQLSIIQTWNGGCVNDHCFPCFSMKMAQDCCRFMQAVWLGKQRVASDHQ